jgi:hypothetical protein
MRYSALPFFVRFYFHVPCIDRVAARTFAPLCGLDPESIFSLQIESHKVAFLRVMVLCPFRFRRFENDCGFGMQMAANTI